MNVSAQPATSVFEIADVLCSSVNLVSRAKCEISPGS